ncbi:MAG: hypothetical protein IJK93_04640 [Muribaculaceae bacterium]|nr:hypothetical protein [Muribaculaceae bacterium]
MNKSISTILFTLALFLIVSAKAKGQTTNDYQGSINAEFSVGLTGYAKDYSYKSIGFAAGYGKTINNSSYIGIGLKPNYIFSDGDFDGFFMPIYGEYKYQPISEAGVRGFCDARIGYSPISKMGLYAHIGGGIIIYQKWEVSIGASYQFTKFSDSYYGEPQKYDYNLVFATLSVGYKF